MNNTNISFNSPLIKLIYEMNFCEINVWLWKQNLNVVTNNFNDYIERAYALYSLSKYEDALELLNNVSNSLESEDEIEYLCKFNQFQLLKVLSGDSKKIEVFNQMVELVGFDIDNNKYYLNKNKIDDQGFIIINKEFENIRKIGCVLSCDLIIRLKSMIKTYWNSTNNNLLMMCENELDKKEYYKYFNNLFYYYLELNYYSENPIIIGRNPTELFLNKSANHCVTEISLEYFDLFILLNYFKIDEVIYLFNKYKVKSISFSKDVQIGNVFSNIIDFPKSAKKNNMFKLFFYIISKVTIEEEEMQYLQRQIFECISLHFIKSKNEFDSIAYFYSNQNIYKSYKGIFYIIRSLENLLIDLLLDPNLAVLIEDYIKEVSFIVSKNCESYYLEESTVKSIIYSINSSRNRSARTLTFIHKLCDKETQKFIEIKIKELLYDNNIFSEADFFICYYSLMNCVIEANDVIDQKLEYFFKDVVKFSKIDSSYNPRFYLLLIIKLYTYNKIKDINIFRKYRNEDDLIAFLTNYKNFDYNNFRIEWMDLIDNNDFHEKVIADKTRKKIIKEKFQEYIINSHNCNRRIKELYFKYYNE